MKNWKLAWMGAVLTALSWGVAAANVAGAPATKILLERPARAPAHPAQAMLQSVTRAGPRLVAVGEHGVVILSDDNGVTWRVARRVPVDVTLLRVKFATPRIGWAIGHMGVVLRTDDGGDTWAKQLDGVRAAQLSLAAAETGASGGADARQQAIDSALALVADGPDKPLLDLVVEDRHRLSVVGAFNTAYRSGDGGQTWVAMAQGLDNPKGLHIYGIAQGPGASFAVGEAGLVLRRVDGAAAYTPLALPYDGTLFGVLQPAGQRVLVYGLRGHAFVSDDSGGHWGRSTLPGEVAVNDGALLSGGRIALGDQGGRLLVSTNGGVSFTAVHKGGIPITGIAEAGDGAVVLATLRGIVRLAPDAIQSSNGSKNQ